MIQTFLRVWTSVSLTILDFKTVKAPLKGRSGTVSENVTNLVKPLRGCLVRPIIFLSPLATSLLDIEYL